MRGHAGVRLTRMLTFDCPPRELSSWPAGAAAGPPATPTTGPAPDGHRARPGRQVDPQHQCTRVGHADDDSGCIHGESALSPYGAAQRPGGSRGSRPSMRRHRSCEIRQRASAGRPTRTRLLATAAATQRGAASGRPGKSQSPEPARDELRHVFVRADDVRDDGGPGGERLRACAGGEAPGREQVRRHGNARAHDRGRAVSPAGQRGHLHGSGPRPPPAVPPRA